MNHRRAHFAAFLDVVGYHESAWRARSGAASESVSPIELLTRVVQSAERGKLDSVFFQDTPGLALFRAQYFPQYFYDAVELLPAFAATTQHIGLTASASTTYNDPYNLARRFATLDHMTGGRAGWNIVTTRYAGAAGNFSTPQHPEHDLRYVRAEEFVDAAIRLWEGWEPDAVIADPATGVWADISKIHEADFHGKFFDITGALPLPRSPQGRPAFAQAGSSGPGIELGGRVGDMIFTAKPDKVSARAFKDDIHASAIRHGRTPNDVVVLPGLSYVLAPTETEANEIRRHLEDLVDGDFRWRLLASNSGLNPELIDPDKPLSQEAIDAAERTKRTEDVIEFSKRSDKTFKQVAAYMTGLPGGLQFTGTPEQMADLIDDWVTSGASDGFTLQPEILPDAIDLFVDHVIPILQRRGIAREEYTATTLRGHLRDDLPADQADAAA